MTETVTPAATPSTPVGNHGSGVVERRLAGMHLKPVTAIAIVAGLIVLVADSQSLALIPLNDTMMTEYNLTPAETSLVMGILAMVGAGAVPVITRIAERISFRLFLNISLAVATVGNLFCALATKGDAYPMLMVGRSILGLSAAAPISLALIREKSTDVKAMNRGIGFVTTMTGVGAAMSYLLGGIVIHYAGNASVVFWVMTILAALSLLAGLILVPDYKVPSKERIDYLGAVLLIIGLTMIALAISYSSSWPISLLLSFIIVGFVILAIWVWVETKVKNPLINLRLTFRRTTVAAYFILGLFSSLLILANLVVTTYAQMPGESLKQLGGGIASGAAQQLIAANPGTTLAQAQAAVGPSVAPIVNSFNGQAFGLTDWAHTVLAASMFLMPNCAMVFICGIVAAPVVAKLGTKVTLILSSVLVVIAFAQLALWHTAWWQNMLGLSLLGIAYGFGYSAGSAAYLHAARDSEAAQFSASGTVIFAGVSSLGASVFTAILTTVPSYYDKLSAAAQHLVSTTPQMAALKQIPASGDTFTWEWVAGLIGGLIMLALALVHKRVKFQGGGQQPAAVDVVSG